VAAPGSQEAEAEAEPAKIPETAKKTDTHRLELQFLCQEEQGEEPKILQAKADNDQVIIAIGGELCKRSDVRRNVLFVVDASGSMNINDPIKDKKCGRKHALEAMISDANQKKMFGLITFSDSVIASSFSFFNNLNEVMQDAAGRANSLDVLCDQQAGTFYDLALDRAITLFTEAPKAEFDELYFISDGAPTISHEGLQEARELKDMGVTIGALMLKGQDTILKREIVSSVNNQPLFFFVNDAASLEEKLADLAALAEGAVLEATVTLRHLDYDVIESYDVLRRATGNRFKIPEFLLPKKTAPDGLLIEYYYRLSSGLEKTYTTEIQWK